MALCALKQGQHRLALAMTLGHVLCLRTGELLTLRFSDLTFSPTCASMVAYLGKSKTGKRTNRSECARSTDKAINIFAKALRPDDDPGAYVINVSEHTFRQQFAKLVSSIGLDPDKATPYSLRRGGATQHFRDGWSFTAIAELGRWG